MPGPFEANFQGDPSRGCRGHRKRDGAQCRYPVSRDRSDGLCARHGYLADGLAYAERILTHQGPGVLGVLADQLVESGGQR